MSRRPRAANSVSLFPFLAVLVCAMGALILLLIVTTRRVRSDALAKAQSAAPSPAVEPIKRKQPIPVPAPVEKSPEKAVVSAKPDRPLLPQTVRIPDTRWHSRTVETPDDPNPALQRTLARLTAERNRRLGMANQAEGQLRIAELDARHLRQVLQSAANRKQTSSQRVLSLQTKAEQSAQDIRNAELEKDSLRREIQRQRDDYARASSEFSIVPFEGNTGTTRRPVFIECTGRAYRFLPEDITLTAADLRGFSADYNPLLTATKSLIDYWSTKHRESGNEPKPYVMLLVRPSGGTSYYVARRLLQNLGHPIGYELIDDEIKLALPKPDPKAQVVCQVGARKAFNRRQQMTQSLAGGIERPETRGRSIRFHRGTGRIEVIDPDQDDRTASGNGNGTGVPRSQDPWRSVLNGRGTSRNPTEGGTANQYNGTATDRRGVVAGERRGGTRYGGSPRSFPGTFGNRNGAGAGTGTGVAGSTPSNATGTPRSRFGEPGSQSGRYGEATAGQGTSDSAGGRRATDGNWTPAHKGGAPRKPGEPGSPRGLSDRGDAGTGDGSPGQRTVGRTTDGITSKHPGGSDYGTAQGRPSENGGQSSTTASAGGQPGAQSQTQSPSASISMGSFGSRRRYRPVKKRWGFSDPGATIGFEREVTVRTTADQMTIGKRYVIRIAKGETTQQLMLRLVTAVEGEARSWGKPPSSFYWVPMLRFVISPGGNPHYQKLRGEVHKLGLQSSVEYKLNDSDQSRNRENQ